MRGLRAPPLLAPDAAGTGPRKGAGGAALSGLPLSSNYA